MSKVTCKIHKKRSDNSCPDCEKQIERIKETCEIEMANIIQGQDLAGVASRNLSLVLSSEFGFLVNAQIGHGRKTQIPGLSQNLETMNRVGYQQLSCEYCGKKCGEYGCWECILTILEMKPWKKNTNELLNMKKKISLMAAPLMLKYALNKIATYFHEQAIQSEDFVGDTDDVIIQKGPYPWYKKNK